jgi:site-specific recombinase XerC
MVRIADDTGTYAKCILDPYDEELSALERAARSEDTEREVAIQLMGRCGLRADEVSYPTRGGLEYSEAGGCWFVEVVGKDTSGGPGKRRDVWVPETVVDNIQRFVSERDRGLADPIVDVSTSTVRRWVREAARHLRDDGHGGRWGEVSSHDLRRSWATYHMVERGTDVRTMMALGGWSDYSAIEPYLDVPTEAKIGRSMSP